MGKTLFEKVWDNHIVDTVDGGQEILFIDRHFIHEVTSPQAFDGIRKRGIGLYDKNRIVATADHNVPTKDQHLPIKDELSRLQVDMLTHNCEEYDIDLYGLGHKNQGIVHVIGPELGVTKPGMTIVCGDSHTSTHGAFGAVAFGIGTSQVEQVMASQCLLVQRPKTMRIIIDGELGNGIYSKDIILYIISKLSTSGGTGHFVEYAGSAIRSLSMEARMTICNMSIEMGARGGMIAPDDTTFEYIKGREYAPSEQQWEEALAYWSTLYTDEDAVFDKEYVFNAEDIEPMITYGTNPGMGMGITQYIPTTQEVERPDNLLQSLQYMGLTPGASLLNTPIDHVFIGSCTNSRIEDLRIVADYVRGKKKADNVQAIIVPGSKQVEAQAKAEGLHDILFEAGFELRGPGCSACLGMNEDKIPKMEYCVSTSNRNYEGRQGPGARTLLVSPLTAAVIAVEGKVVDPRKYLNEESHA
jgi:3-isopropylmalate/(R)-2-methylmalate dehydratase large subunit